MVRESLLQPASYPDRLVLVEAGLNLNHRAWASKNFTTNPLKMSPNPIMETKKVGVKSPDVGTPPAVEGMLVRAEAVEVGVGVRVGTLVGVGLTPVGFGEGVSVAEGVAVNEGVSLVPAAKTVKVRVMILPK